MPSNNFNINGLSQEQVLASREKYGKNAVDYQHKNAFWEALKGFLKDPMVILLRNYLPFVFKGIVAFYDPPKKNIQAVLI